MPFNTLIPDKNSSPYALFNISNISVASVRELNCHTVTEV
jgi:hypothetical protein